MEVEVWGLKPGSRPTGASLRYTLNRGPVVLFSDSQPMDSLVKNSLTWSKVSKSFIIPDVTDSSLQISLFVDNPRRAPLFIDDLRITYRYHWNSTPFSGQSNK